MRKSIFPLINTLFGKCQNVINFLPLPFAQEKSFFSAFLHGFNSGSKNSSVVCVAIRDVTTGTGTYVGISVDGTVKSLCASGCFKSHS